MTRWIPLESNALLSFHLSHIFFNCLSLAFQPGRLHVPLSLAYHAQIAAPQWAHKADLILSDPEFQDVQYMAWIKRYVAITNTPMDMDPSRLVAVFSP